MASENSLTVEPGQSPEKSPFFLELAASRRKWIDEVLKPWCQSACLRDLRQAELEWFDLAGKVDPAVTLWTWSWERFPDLVHPDLPGVHETYRVEVQLRDGRSLSGYPDSRKSRRGMLVLVDQVAGRGMTEAAPISIDEVVAAKRATEA